MMVKKITRIATTSGAVATLFGLAVLLLAATTAQAAERPVIGEVTRVIGAASAVHGDAARPVNAGSRVRADDELRTGNASRLAVLFADGTQLMLGADSRLVLDRFVYEPDRREGNAVMTMVSGVFRLISGALSKSGPDALAIDTPLATLGIRGTDFWGEVSADHVGVLLLDDGVVEIAGTGGRSVLERPGDGVDVNQGEAPTQPGAWGAPRVEAAKRSVSWRVER